MTTKDARSGVAGYPYSRGHQSAVLGDTSVHAFPFISAPTGPIAIHDTLSSVAPGTDPADRLNAAAMRRYADALAAGTASPVGVEVTIVVTPLAVSDAFLVRLDCERDAFTVSEHPLEAAGWLLWHVRKYGPGMFLHVRHPRSADVLLTTTVLQAACVANFLIEDDQMEKPVALQHLDGSTFNLRQRDAA